MTDTDLSHLQGWIGKKREAQDVITPRLANSVAAILNEAPTLRNGDMAPPGIHWCLSPDIVPMSGLGPDGHPARGDFLPPVPLPRRMWAGGELHLHGPFRVGDAISRRSSISDVIMKNGRTGPLCFVTVDHEYYGPAGLALSERHDIVYRPLQSPTDARPSEATPSPDVRYAVDASSTLLARFSAVTFNGHRIHYDRDYCLKEEGYPGLLVHGPLQATLLLSTALGMAASDPLKRFTYRSLAPLFDGSAFSVNGARRNGAYDLWISSAAGNVTMRATAE